MVTFGGYDRASVGNGGTGEGFEEAARLRAIETAVQEEGPYKLRDEARCAYWDAENVGRLQRYLGSIIRLAEGGQASCSDLCKGVPTEE